MAIFNSYFDITRGYLPSPVPRDAPKAHRFGRPGRSKVLGTPDLAKNKERGYPIDGLQLTLVTGGLSHKYTVYTYLLPIYYLVIIYLLSIYSLFIIYLSSIYYLFISIYLYYRPSSCQTSGMILRGKNDFFCGKMVCKYLI